jgi:type IV secretion system protein VirB2
MSDSILLSDPGSSVLVRAVSWLEHAMFGSLATMIAVLAVGLLGFALLTGRTDPKRAIRVAAGCFILFGAPAIANGLLAVSRGQGDSIAIKSAAGTAPPSAPIVPANPFDPYAGASVPMDGRVQD